MTDLEIVTLFRRCIEALHPISDVMLIVNLEMAIKKIEGRK